MIYPESSINEGVIRFLTEKEIDIKLLNKINKNELKNRFHYSTTEDIFQWIFCNIYYECGIYKTFLNKEELKEIPIYIKKEDFFLE